MHRPLCLVCLLVSAFTVGARADSSFVELTAAADNTLYEDEPGRLSNGRGAIFAGSTAAGLTRRGLLRFDLTGAVPDSAIVTGVTVRLFLDRTVAGEEVLTFHRLLAPWGEGSSIAPGEGGGGGSATSGDATWIHRFRPDEFWGNPGGDFDATVSAETSVGGEGFYAWSGERLTDDVNSWLADPTTNHGWILLGNESESRTAKRFLSHESFPVSSRPALLI